MILNKQKLNKKALKNIYITILITGLVVLSSGIEVQAQTFTPAPNTQNNNMQQPSAANGGNFTIQGQGFDHLNEVILRGNDGEFTTRGVSFDGRTLVVRIPPGLQAGTYEVIVRNQQGESSFSNVQVAASSQQVVPSPVGTPHNMQSQTQPVTNGGNVTIQGQGFDHLNEVVINGSGEEFTTRGVSFDGITLVIRIPPGLPAGTYEVTVRNGQGESNFSNVQVEAFPHQAVASPNLPQPHQSPVTASFNSSSSFTIQGQGFEHSNEVIIRGNGNHFVTSGRSADGRTLVVSTPPNINEGSYEVIVRNQQGESSFSNVQIHSSSKQQPASSGKSLSLPRPCLFGFILCPKQVHAASTSYVALGDSLAFGAIAIRGYVPRYAGHIENDNRVGVEVKNRGVRGLQSSELLTRLQTNQALQNEIAQADIITWNIGGNDLLIARNLYQSQNCGGQDNQDCLRATLQNFKQNWDGILQSLLTIQQQGGSSAIMRSMTIYYPQVAEDMSRNSWPNGTAQNDFEVLNAYLIEANRHIVQTLQANNIPYAPVWQAFNGANGTEDAGQKGLISYDRVHPNDQGHSLIARLLQQLGYSGIDRGVSQTTPQETGTMQQQPVSQQPLVSQDGLTMPGDNVTAPPAY